MTYRLFYDMILLVRDNLTISFEKRLYMRFFNTLYRSSAVKGKQGVKRINGRKGKKDHHDGESQKYKEKQPKSETGRRGIQRGIFGYTRRLKAVA